MTYVLEQGAGYLRQCVEMAGRVRDEAGIEALAGSQLLQELAETTGRRHQHVLDAVSIAAFRMAAADDHLLAVSRLVPHPSAVYSIYTLARTVAEVSARAWWLLDPSIGSGGRAERGLAERIYGITEAGKLPIEGIAEHTRARVAELRRLAQAEGLSISREHKSPGGGEVLRELMGRDEESRSLGDHTYKLLSAFTHGTSYALQQLIHRDTIRGSEIDGMGQVQVGTSASKEAVALLMAFLPYMEATQRQSVLHGWDASQLSSQLLYTSSELRRHLDENSDSYVAD
jgi:hypothetical protein